MSENKDFIIQIKGLQIGKHYYDFPIDGSFFKNFENSQILDADLNAKILLEKGSGWINVTAHVSGNVVVECDRCLDDLTIPMDFENSMAVKFSKALSPEDSDGDEFLVIDPAEGELDLTQFIYDYVCLNLPLQKVHKEGECNPVMVEKLKMASANEGGKEEAIKDSPFGVLKDLLKKDS